MSMSMTIIVIPTARTRTRYPLRWKRRKSTMKNTKRKNELI